MQEVRVGKVSHKTQLLHASKVILLFQDISVQIKNASCTQQLQFSETNFKICLLYCQEKKYSILALLAFDWNVFLYDLFQYLQISFPYAKTYYISVFLLKYSIVFFWLWCYHDDFQCFFLTLINVISFPNSTVGVLAQLAHNIKRPFRLLDHFIKEGKISKMVIHQKLKKYQGQYLT